MSDQRPHASHLPAKPKLRHLKDQAKGRLANGEAPSLAVALFQVAHLYGFQSGRSSEPMCSHKRTPRA